MELITYKKYRSEEEALALVAVLETHAIEYHVENIAPPVDITFTGGSQLDDKFDIQLKKDDFEKADALLNKLAQENTIVIDKDHYLFEFSDEELFDILGNFDEWGEVDFALAQKILNDRGRDVSDEKVKELIDKKHAKLRQPTKGKTGWLIAGVMGAIVSGVVGVLIGYHYFKYKKIIPTGEKVFAYDSETRKKGSWIMYLGIASSLFWIIRYTLPLM